MTETQNKDVDEDKYGNSAFDLCRHPNRKTHEEYAASYWS